jgi:hypothetical protein
VLDFVKRMHAESVADSPPNMRLGKCEPLTNVWCIGTEKSEECK